MSAGVIQFKTHSAFPPQARGRSKPLTFGVGVMSLKLGAKAHPHPARQTIFRKAKNRAGADLPPQGGGENAELSSLMSDI